MEAIRSQPGAVVARYLKFWTQVCCQVYGYEVKAAEHFLEREAEHKQTPFLIFQSQYLRGASATLSSRTAALSSRPAPQARKASTRRSGMVAEAGAASRASAEAAVPLPQEVPQEAGRAAPADSHCRRQDDRNLCKAEFPRTKWLVDRAVVLCHGFIQCMGMALTGRRSKLCSMHGPMNHESLNGSHPALLAALRCNSDVLLLFWLPLTAATHACEESCIEDLDEGQVVQAAQLAQDAQAGYTCDYCIKRQPMAVKEIKEWCKQLRHQKRSYIGKRHAARLMSDAYGKGVVRSHVESTNLRANAKDNAVTHAETFRTAQTETFFGREYLEP